MLSYYLTSWLYGPPTALDSLITDPCSYLSTTYRQHLLNFISRKSFYVYILQLSQPRSSCSTTSLRFTLKYLLNCPSLIHSYYVSNPFHSFLFLSATISKSLYSSLNSRLDLFLHTPCSTTVPCILFNIILSHVPSLVISISAIAHISLPHTTTVFTIILYILILTVLLHYTSASN